MSASQPTHSHWKLFHIPTFTAEGYEDNIGQVLIRSGDGFILINMDQIIAIRPNVRQTTPGTGPAINRNRGVGSAGVVIGAASSLRIPSITLIKPDGSTAFVIPSPSDRLSTMTDEVRIALKGHSARAAMRILAQWLKKSKAAHKAKQAKADKKKGPSILSLMCCCGLPIGRGFSRSRRSGQV